MKQPRTLSREKCKVIKQKSKTCKTSCKEFLQGIFARTPAMGTLKFYLKL
jgi:hypothetical protein